MNDLFKDEPLNNINRTHLLLQQMTQLTQFNVENGNKDRLPQLLEKILNLAIEFIDAESGFLFTFDQYNIAPSCICVTPLSGHKRSVLLEVGKIAAQEVIQSNTPIYISDSRVWMETQLTSKDELPYKAILSIPMHWQGQLMGVIQFWDNHGINYFKEDTAELINLLANQSAALLHNVTVLETEHQQRILAEKLASAATTLTSSLDINYILENILRLLADVVPYDSASIMLAERDTLTLVAQRGLTIDSLKEPIRFPIDDPLFDEIKQKRAPVILEDASKDSRFHGWLNTQNIHGWMGIPLISRDEVIGYITLDSYKPNAYQKIHGQWASAFANQAAMIIENARLFQENEKRANDLEALRQVSLSLITNIELEKVLDAILQSVFILLPNVRNAHIFLYHPQEEDQFRFGAALWSDGQRGKPVAPPRKNGLTSMVAQTGKLIAVEDMREHPLYREMPSNWNGSIIGIPLKIGTWVVGVMNVSFSEPRIFPENELRLLGFL
ncbi:MAG: GAF domain-containing protein, partial [Anaerolineales bacterium]